MVEVIPYVSPDNEGILFSSDSYRTSHNYPKRLFNTLNLPSNWVYIYLIRHGQSLANETPDILWWRSDFTVLSNRWISQSQLLWDHLRHQWVNFDKVFSSTATRAFQTAKVTLDWLWDRSSDIELSHLLQEISHWDWEWWNRKKLRTPDVIEKMVNLTWDYKSPWWESQKEVENRMSWWVSEIVDSMNFSEWKKKVAVFSHWLAIKCFLRAILNLKPSETWKLAIDNTSVTKLFYDGKNWYILAVNDTSHFPRK